MALAHMHMASLVAGRAIRDFHTAHGGGPILIEYIACRHRGTYRACVDIVGACSQASSGPAPGSLASGSNLRLRAKVTEILGTKSD